MELETYQPKVRCSAHRTNGAPCKAYPINGSNVCRTHGGSAPQVKRKAEERLRELQAPSVEALGRALSAERRALDAKGRIRKLGPDTAAQTRAATAVLDRTGLGPSSTTNVNVEAGERLAQLMGLLDRTEDRESGAYIIEAQALALPAASS